MTSSNLSRFEFQLSQLHGTERVTFEQKQRASSRLANYGRWNGAWALSWGSSAEEAGDFLEIKKPLESLKKKDWLSQNQSGEMGG